MTGEIWPQIEAGLLMQSDMRIKSIEVYGENLVARTPLKFGAVVMEESIC